MADHDILIERNREMTARDGTVLRADIVRPNIKAKVPAIVARTPYDKNQQFQMQGYLPPYTAAQAGYAFVFQDIRGRYASEGEWDFVNLKAANVEDGYDTIEWVSSQDWCDGNVGMAGGSYVAVTQISAGLADPPSLKAIAPALLGIGSSRSLSHTLPLESMTVGWMAGLALDRLVKLLPTGEANPMDLLKALEAMTQPEKVATALPLNELFVLDSIGMPQYSEVDELVSNVAANFGEAQLKIPALWTNGWYDNAGGAEMFTAMREHAASDLARSDTRLIMGAWTHNYALSFVGAFGLGALGSSVGGGIPQLHLTYYDRHLRGADADIEPVRYFVMGAKTWRTADDWPIPGTDFRRYYLHTRGELSLDTPAASEAPDRYTYDPSDPAPSWGFRVMYTGGTTVAGPFEQTRVEQRDDVLTYTSAPMTSPTEVVGDIDLHLFFASSAPDTDLIAKLCVVWPDGSSFNLADAELVLRRRGGPGTESSIVPGEINEIKLELGPTGYLFEPGMCIRVQVTSSAFPHLARNLNTGEPIGEGATPVVAENTVFHDADHPSYVVIPVQPEPGPMAPMTHLMGM
jgi:putative CocE/NonD family hydrolase